MKVILPHLKMLLKKQIKKKKLQALIKGETIYTLTKDKLFIRIKNKSG